MRMLLLPALCALLSGCNSVRGVGEDMAAVGRTMIKVSSTSAGGSGDLPQPQAYDGPHDDQAYATPAELPQP